MLCGKLGVRTVSNYSGESHKMIDLNHVHKSKIKEATICGRVSDILQDVNGVVLVVLENFQVLSSRDEVYGMPVLVRRDSETTFSIVIGKVLLNHILAFVCFNFSLGYQIQLQCSA